MTEDAFSGSLAFGLTSCDPDQVPASCLPADSDELLERPEYWVCIKDVGASPQVGTTLNFKVDCTGRVLFSKNDALLE
uniref:NHR domain-containing protein n=1 Tax=Meloidogyne incognita TaxID=6306 RepID=A0A914P4Y0_MELIC